MALTPSILDAIGLERGITRFWLVRHALVEENARAQLYGVRDVPLCPESLGAQVPMYQALAQRLPQQSSWIVTPLSRTRITAEAIARWRVATPDFVVEEGLIEQDLGEWQGLPHADLPGRLATEAHPFWPVAADERPPGGESFATVCDRVGRTMERLAEDFAGQDIVAVSHGGAIRAAVAHALELTPDQALKLSVQNLSVTVLEKHPASWRVVSINELPGV
jgi:broad specificity phosphatase PhoE